MTDPAIELRRLLEELAASQEPSSHGYSHLSASQDYHTQKYVEIMSKAIPATGYRPQTKREWARLQQAMIDASYHMYRANGVPKAEATRMARLIHGGAAGRMLLEMAFGGPESGEAARD